MPTSFSISPRKGAPIDWVPLEPAVISVNTVDGGSQGKPSERGEAVYRLYAFERRPGETLGFPTDPIAQRRGAQTGQTVSRLQALCRASRGNAKTSMRWPSFTRRFSKRVRRPDSIFRRVPRSIFRRQESMAKNFPQFAKNGMVTSSQPLATLAGVANSHERGAMRSMRRWRRQRCWEWWSRVLSALVVTRSRFSIRRKKKCLKRWTRAADRPMQPAWTSVARAVLRACRSEGFIRSRFRVPFTVGQRF